MGISYLGFRVRRLRPFLKGEPIVLVEKGKIIYRIMRRERLTLDDLAEKARISEIESLDEVQWAVWRRMATSASHRRRQPPTWIWR